jgi:hypothetical protein
MHITYTTPPAAATAHSSAAAAHTPPTQYDARTMPALALTCRRRCCDSLLNCAVVALNTRKGGLKAKRNDVDVEQDESSVQSYQHKEDVQ